jgi:hypothetical protein
VLGLVRLGGIATVLAFLLFLTVSLRRERRARPSDIRATGTSAAPFDNAQSRPVNRT